MKTHWQANGDGVAIFPLTRQGQVTLGARFHVLLLAIDGDLGPLGRPVRNANLQVEFLRLFGVHRERDDVLRRELRLHANAGFLLLPIEFRGDEKVDP